MLQNDKYSLSRVPNLSRAAGYRHLQSYQREVTTKSHTVFTKFTACVGLHSQLLLAAWPRGQLASCSLSTMLGILQRCGKCLWHPCLHIMLNDTDYFFY